MCVLLSTQRTRGAIGVTGFGPFGDIRDNPSGWIAERLEGDEVGPFVVKSEVFDVAFSSVRDRVVQLVRTGPHAMILLGVARAAARLRLESRAVNRMRASIPDLNGVRAVGQLVDERFPPDAVLETNVRPATLARRLKARGLDAEVSHDAGRYVCNATYFHALRICREKAIPCLFVHVPPWHAPDVQAEREERANEILALVDELGREYLPGTTPLS